MQENKSNTSRGPQKSSKHGSIIGELKVRVTKTKSQKKNIIEPLITEEYEISEESWNKSGTNPRSRKFRESIIGDFENLSYGSVVQVEIENNAKKKDQVRRPK